MDKLNWSLKAISDNKNNILDIWNTNNSVSNILENKTINEIKKLMAWYLKSKKFNAIIDLIDSNFIVNEGNITINHWDYYKDMSWVKQRRYLMNLYSWKETNFKKVLYLLVKIFWIKKHEDVNLVLINFIEDESLLKIINKWDFELKVHNFNLQKKWNY